MDRVTCRDQYGGVRIRLNMGVMDALQTIYDLRYHPIHGSWAQRAVCLDHTFRHVQVLVLEPVRPFADGGDNICI